MKNNHISTRKGVACYAHVLATILAFAITPTLTGCGEHGFEEWLFGESSSSEEDYGLSSSSGGSEQGIVEPLLQTKWGQGDPYNSELPFKENGTRAITGCGVIATSQIMKYHRYPVRGTGQSQPYPVQTGTQPSVNFNVAYDWDNMLDKYTSSATDQQRKAVGTLAYHVGVSTKRDFVKFGYGPEGSIAKHVSLTANFGYDKSVQRLDRKFYEDAEWEGIIKRQLDARLPVYYVGYTGTGSDHAFILDGYDNAGKFHVNWGWTGSKDGWFSLNALKTGEDVEWHNGNWMLINIKPNGGGTPAPYEMALNSFTASKASVPQNELFTVSAQMRNNSTFETFPGGQLGAALVNSSGNIVKVIGAINYNALNAQSSRTSTINAFVPENVNPGSYKLRIATKVEGENWKLVERSAIRDGVPKSINLTVTAGEAKGGGYGLSIENFAPDKTSVPQNGKFSVAVRTRNVGLDEFGGGQLEIALVNNSGSIFEVVKTATWNSLIPNSTRSGTLSNCTIPATVPPGQYKLRIVIKPTGSDEWRVATMSMPDVPTSIGFRVE